MPSLGHVKRELPGPFALVHDTPIQIVAEDPSPPTAGARFRRAVARDLARGRQRDKTCADPAGIGRSSLPLWLIARDLAEGRLARIPAGGFGARGETVVRAYFMHRGDEPLGPAAKACREALLRRAGRQPHVPG